jgi:N-acetylglucosamine-6-phosphate deacetylase
MVAAGSVEGRLVLDDQVVDGRITIEDGLIVGVELDESSAAGAGSSPAGKPVIAPGFVDVHVHGGGGHDAMGGREALDGMARHLLRHGVTSFLPTAVSAPLPRLARFADDVRAWRPAAPIDGAEPLGFDLEGPFLAPARREDLEPLLAGLRLTTIAPELPGAIELIAWLHERGVATSLGHSVATFEEAVAGYAAGATSTTHLFNAMSGVDHHAPGLAVAALDHDAVYVELIADGEHVHPSLWPIITRTKPPDRLMLVSDAISMAGMGDGRAKIGGLEVEVVGQRVTLVGTTTLAGSVLTLDVAVRNMVAAGVPLRAAVAAASANPVTMLGISDRGRIAPGQRADLIEVDPELRVRRVMRAGTWFPGEAA